MIKPYIRFFLGVALAMGFSVPVQATAIYMVGAQLYTANSTTGGHAGLFYQYSTNSAVDGGHALLPLDLQGDASGISQVGISFALSVGDNVFDFRPQTDNWGNFPQLAYGLNLFINDTGASYNPARSGPGIAGDLTVAVQTDLSTFFVPVAGTSVQSYNTSNSLPYLVAASANGNTLINVGGYNVSVTAFSENGGPITCGFFGCVGGDPDPSGSFTITVAPASVPEPATIILMGLGLAGLGVARRRRNA